MKLFFLPLLASIALAQSPGTFTATGDMTTPRSRHTATLLGDGSVLIVGGAASSSAELYDPRTDTFKATGDLTTPRAEHTATLLPDGKVLIAGGAGAVPSAELYDPVSKTFSPTGDMTVGRTGHAATLLPSGKVLIVGGWTDGTTTDSTRISAELYAPFTGTFTPAGNLVGPSSGATLLASGKVLITGLDYFPGSPVDEIYDPSMRAFTLTGTPRTCCESRATLLINGKVLASYGDGGYLPAVGDVYDPAFGTFSPTESSTTTWVGDHTATLLSDGTVLLTGGDWGEATAVIVYSAHAEIYDPARGAFGSTGNMNANRWGHTATLLNDGRVLIAGGYSFVGSVAPDGHSAQGRTEVLSSTEVYTPAVLAGPPALLSLSGDGKGQGAILHAGTHQVVSSDNPATAGEPLEIYLIGLIEGSVIPPQVAIGGRMAELLFFGKAPGFEGLNQVNVRVPSGVAPGPEVSVRLTYVGRSSNMVTIGVQ
jgi:hypothetical protein